MYTIRDRLVYIRVKIIRSTIRCLKSDLVMILCGPISVTIKSNNEAHTSRPIRYATVQHVILVYIQQNQSPQDRSGYVWGRHERSKKSPQSRTSLLLHLLFALPAITVAARLGGQMSTIIRLIVRTVRHCAGVKNSLKWPPPTNRCGVAFFGRTF